MALCPDPGQTMSTFFKLVINLRQPRGSTSWEMSLLRKTFSRYFPTSVSICVLQVTLCVSSLLKFWQVLSSLEGVHQTTRCSATLTFDEHCSSTYMYSLLLYFNCGKLPSVACCDCDWGGIGAGKLLIDGRACNPGKEGIQVYS